MGLRGRAEGKGEASTWAGKCPLSRGGILGQGWGAGAAVPAGGVTPSPGGYGASWASQIVLPQVGTEDHPFSWDRSPQAVEAAEVRVTLREGALGQGNNAVRLREPLPLWGMRLAAPAECSRVQK